MYIKIDNKDTKASCTIMKLQKYSMNCIIEGVNCVQDIILTNNAIQPNPNQEIFAPHSVFFYDFNNKRTFTIKAGKLNKGTCNNDQYIFSFTNNVITYNDNDSFNLRFTSISNANNDLEALCSLTKDNNEIICTSNSCPKEEDDLKITEPQPPSKIVNSDTIWYENFVNSYTTSIINNKGKIIKVETEKEFTFNITNNILKEDKAVDLKINLKLLNVKTRAICKGSKPENDYTFDFICTSSELSPNNEIEIEISAEPTHSIYYFYGYKNKKTLTIEAGQIMLDLNLIKNKEFKIINNKFIGDSSKLTFEKALELKINYIDDDYGTASCNLDSKNIIDNNINITCKINDNKNIEEIFSVVENPEGFLINDNDNDITLNFIKYKSLTVYNIKLEKIIKGGCDTNNYIFTLIDTTLYKSMNINRIFSLPIKINDESQISSCTIVQNSLKFDMICKIENYCPPENYDIIIEKQIINDFNSLNTNTIYINIQNEISTSTLTPGYIIKGNCKNGIYQFGIYNNIITGNNFDLGNIGVEFKLQFKLQEKLINEGSCSLNPTNKIISCNYNIDKDNEFCTNINKDFKKNSLSVDNYIIINDNILHLNKFENLETISVVAGDLQRGVCNGDIYEFSFINSKIYNDISSEKEIKFPLKLYESNPETANCNVPNKLVENNIFNINCKIEGTNGECPLYPPDKDITVISNPGYRNINSKVFNFVDFLGKSSIITITSGILSGQFDKEKKQYYLLFSESTIDYTLTSDYSFKINYELNGEKEKTNCIFDKNTKNINCIIDNINSDQVNIKIISNPIDDIETFYRKTIIFKDFENKEINTFVAGKLIKGNCEEGKKTYQFFFNNSKTQIVPNKQILLKMKVPDRISLCNVIPNNDNNEDTYTVDCIIEGTNTCPIESDEDIVVGDEEPEPIRISDKVILYFSSFSGKNTLEYIITLENLLKSEVKNCKYYFKFSNEPFALDFFTNEIPFSFDLFFNGENVKADCILSEDKNNINIIDVKNILLICNFDLKEDICKSKDLNSYDLEIKEDVEINWDDELLYNIKLDGLNNKKTITIVAGNTKDKYIEDDKYIFILENNKKTDILKDIESFDLHFTSENKPDNFIAECKLSDNNNIKCESNKDSLSINDDFIIKKNPEYLLLSNVSVYFEKFKDIRTFTIKAGQIQLLQCKEEGENYKFNLVNTLSSEEIPKQTEFKINIFVDNEDNAINTATCITKPSSKYSMSCTIEGINCVKDIILADNTIDSPNKEIFAPNTTFFNDFNNKRTISIYAGKIIKGNCDSQQNYNFSFVNNTFTYVIDKNIDFDLTIPLKDKSPIAKCNLSLSGKDNTILCNIEGICPREEEDIIIKADPSPNYSILFPNSLFYFDFINKNTTTLVMKDSGMIIKGENEENGFYFIITDNVVKDIKDLDGLKDFEIKISNLNNNPICNIVQTEDLSNTFNIKCLSNILTINDEILIIENPIVENDDYYFAGYKDKRAITLECGSIEKDKNSENKFNIVKNKFIGNITDLKFDKPILIDIRFSEETFNSYKCNFNSQTIVDNYIDISCDIPKNIKDSKTIIILDNPEAILLSDSKTTVNFINFTNLTFYTLTPGKILKDQCNPTSFVFYLVNTTISKELDKIAYFTLPIKINNKDEEKLSTCQIKSNITIFKMYCVISNFCPSENIDIKIEANKYYPNIPSLSPNSIYIDIPKEISSTTLKIGYIRKLRCLNNLYEFSINENEISGPNVGNITAKYQLNMSQFENEASCTIDQNSYIINCSLNINEKNKEEKSICENINKDIKVENIIGDNYIQIGDNIVNYYGFEKLESFTVEGGDLNRGHCNDNIYEFIFKNSTIYNNLLNEQDNLFSLKLIKPKELDAICKLPANLKINNIFDITCSITGENICDTILDKDLGIGENNPNDIIIGTKRVNFQNFTQKSSIVNISAGMLLLEKEDKKYYLNFSDSIINYKFNEDFSFFLKFNLGKIEQKERCKLAKNSKNIICDISNATSDDLEIKILEEPYDNYDYFEGKTLIFTNFENKEIHTFIAGTLEKGSCNGNFYIFTFKDSKSQYNIENNIDFKLEMKYPNRIANCEISKTKNISIYDVVCFIEGENTCPVDVDDDITINNANPKPLIISSSSILYYFSFAKQTTSDFSYNLSGGILSKKSIEKINKDNFKYTFKISDCSIDKSLENETNFNITINLELYDNGNKEFPSECLIPSGVSELNKFDLECSFIATNSDYNDDKYDIKVKSGDYDFNLNEEQIIHISNLGGLSTITLHDCIILKGKCDNNKKYSYTFSNCKYPQKINEFLEFTLKTNNKEESNCKYTSNNPESIQCEIENSIICEEENEEKDIVIGENNPEIDYSKYYNHKNFYISGLKNLYTTTLKGGLLNFGNCEHDSKDYIFYFNNTILTYEISDDIEFSLNIKEPSEMNSKCTIPKNSKEFSLNCIINGKDDCPISDYNSLKIEEIIEEIQISFSQNTCYIKNLRNRNFILLKAGTLTLGKCEDKKYLFSFIDSEIYGDIQPNEFKNKEFLLNLTNPQTEASCSLNVNYQNELKIDINCYINGESHCAIYNYSYLEIGENDPSNDTSILFPNIVEFSDFKNKKIDFNNYYISISDKINNKCINDQYEFDLITTPYSERIPDDKFYLTLNDAKKTKNYNAVCAFQSTSTNDEISKIHCVFEETIDIEKLYLKFEYYLIDEEKDTYLINLGDKKSFEFNNCECPVFIPETQGEIKPEENPELKNSFIFIIEIITSYNKEEVIEIFYYNGIKKEENIVIFYLISFNGPKLANNILEEEENIVKCYFPEKFQNKFKIRCIAENVNDNESDYFKLRDTTDIIKIQNKVINFKITEKIKNIFKSEDSPDSTDPEPDDDDEEEEETEEEETEQKEKSGIYKAGIAIFVIVVIFLCILIALVLLYFFYFKKKEENMSGNSSYV